MMVEYGLYTLDENGLPLITTDHDAWGKWFMDPAHRQVAETIIGARRVSTVFMGIARGFNLEGNVILWETMVFDEEGKPSMSDQYASVAEAKAGHARWVESLRGSASLPS